MVQKWCIFFNSESPGMSHCLPFLRLLCVACNCGLLGLLMIIAVQSLWLSFTHVKMVKFFVLHMTQKDGMCLILGNQFVSLVYIRQPELFVGDRLSWERC